MRYWNPLSYRFGIQKCHFFQAKDETKDSKPNSGSYDSNEENGNASSVNKNGLEQPENGFRYILKRYIYLLFFLNNHISFHIVAQLEVDKDHLQMKERI